MSFAESCPGCPIAEYIDAQIAENDTIRNAFVGAVSDIMGRDAQIDEDNEGLEDCIGQTAMELKDLRSRLTDKLKEIGSSTDNVLDACDEVEVALNDRGSKTQKLCYGAIIRKRYFLTGQKVVTCSSGIYSIAEQCQMGRPIE